MTSTGDDDGSQSPSLEPCPNCGLLERVRRKLILVDDAWQGDATDSREAYFADFRIDDLKPKYLNAKPLQQFVDGLFCDLCAEGFLPDAMAKDTIRRYYGVGLGTKKISSKDGP